MSNPRDLERLARHVNPGGWAIENERPIATLLGSCVAVCLWDPQLRIGGLNHFMLPKCQSIAEAESSYASTLLVAPKKTDIELF